MFNKVVLVGNLTRDIELRYTTNGAAIGNCGIAVTRRFTTNGEKREETCFVDITFFGKQAEIANQYLSKGSKLLIEGRLKYDQWTDNNGQNRSKHTVVVENMEMLGGQSANQGGGGYQSQNSFNSNQGGHQNSFNQSNQQRFNQAQPSKKRTESFDDDYDTGASDSYEQDDSIPF